MISKTAQLDTSPPPWLETEAKVTACHYEFARMNTLTLGIATDSNQFLISFTYYAHGKTFSDEFTSPVAIEQGETFAVCYNPLNPQQNTKSASTSTSRTALFTIGVAGSILFSLLYLSMMHGCD